MRLAFTARRLFPGTRYGPAVLSDVYVVGVDGSGERRLTGVFDPGVNHGVPSASPTWSPDGRRLFFLSARAGVREERVWTMNTDGTCETPFGPASPRLVGAPAWRPGVGVSTPEKACADLVVTGEGREDAVALSRRTRFAFTVENDGNVHSADATARIAASRGIVRGLPFFGPCSRSARVVTCEVGRVAPREGRVLEFSVASATAGRLFVTVTVTGGADPVAGNSRVQLATVVLPCTIAGTRFADTLRGTPGRDRICGRPGWDRIFGRGGDDTLLGGSGDDRIDTGSGRDSVAAGLGHDVVLARDQTRDVIACGPQRDVVVADRLDRVGRDCEVVYR
jgi:hypothetical protein